MGQRRRTLGSGALVVLIAAVVALVVVLASSGGGGGHMIRVTVPDATNVIAGQYVKAGAVNVGTVDSITAVDGGRAARLNLKLDNSVWPLRQGTTMQLRWGGTVSFVNRYILLTRGTKPGPSIVRDGVFPASSFSTPVEFDSLVNTFDPSTRAGLTRFLDNAGVALHDAGPALRAAIEVAPAALAQTSSVLGDLDASESALNGLVEQGAQVVDAVHRADPGIGPLVRDAATTFAALASRTQQLQSTLQNAPSTLAQARQTLAAADPTLTLAKTVTARIAPGVAQVRRIAAPLDDLLSTLTSVGPDAISALHSARVATPSLNPLLVKATSVMPQLRSIGSQGVTSLDCVRPYTPDIIAFASDWADFLSGVDGQDHYFRAQVQTLIPATFNAQVYDSAQMKQLLPWVSYVYPPPPGWAAGQPWFLPQCNEGPSTLNAADDSENNGKLPELPAANATPISLPEPAVR
jgi:virulence factor Mce-like protein